MQGEGHDPEDLLGACNGVERRHMPERLFTAGNLNLLHEGGRVAVVGSRNASSEGLAGARPLARLLVAEGIVVISGLAKGIDAAAHGEAIGRGGQTIAIIGTPLNREYPSENRRLQHRLMEEQLVVSQFPEGYATKPGCFPMRNRTMALIARFGSFHGFVWDTTFPRIRGQETKQTQFRELNIVYGRNFSGKTTLSQVVRCLERRRLPPRYDEPDFVAHLDDGGCVRSSELEPCTLPARVFSRPYVIEHHPRHRSRFPLYCTLGHLLRRR